MELGFRVTTRLEIHKCGKTGRRIGFRVVLEYHIPDNDFNLFYAWQMEDETCGTSSTGETLLLML